MQEFGLIDQYVQFLQSKLIERYIFFNFANKLLFFIQFDKVRKHTASKT